ncbi:MAG: SpoIIE family protein phosphatase [Brevinematales bacterium]|nr:SpoIIE family protein phosphatase [Brevinematales bacterium]
MSPKAKTKETQKTGIRRMRFTLKIKITILVFFLLIFTIAITANFIIQYQNKILDDQMSETMSVYLNTFKQTVSSSIFERNDRFTLQQFLTSYQSIPSFWMAMFVDNEGTIIVHSQPENIGKPIAAKNQWLLESGFEELPHLMNNSNAEGVNYYIDGFLPVYLSDEFGVSELNNFKKFYDQYKDREIFALDRYPDELRNNLSLIFLFDKLYTLVYNDKKELSALSQALMKDSGVTSSDIQFLRDMNKNFQDYMNGYEFDLKKDTIDRLVKILALYGMPDEAGKKYLDMKDKNRLFVNKNLVNDRVKNELKFLTYLRQFLDRYVTSDKKTTEAFDKEIIDKVKKIKQSQMIWYPVKRSYYTALFFQLLDNLKNFEKAMTEDGTVSQFLAENTFRSVFNIYRLGSVRILLKMDKIQAEREKIANQTVDIAILFILRMLVVTFFVVSFIIRPLNTLAKGTDEIAGGLATGNIDILDNDVLIKNHDELGQLADKFNIMTRNLKKAFLEVRDKARMEEELRIAMEIQTAILPSSLPELPGYQFAHYYEPQSESGGDYYDFLENDPDHLGIVVADVTNHGVGAAMVMAVLRSALRSAADQKMDPSRVLKHINPILLRDSPPNMFATVFYGVLDIKKSELIYSIAGHEQGILFNNDDKKMRLLKTGGLPVGIMDSAIFDPQIELFKATLRKGDYFLQYTDGIVEAKSATGEEYGNDRFYRAIMKYASDDLDSMCRGIIADLKEFTAKAPQSDDITLLIMKIL